jgi:hypothetical protein
MLIKDLADHRLEIARFRSIKAGFMRTACEDSIQSSQSHWHGYADKQTSSLKSGAAATIRNLKTSIFAKLTTPEELAQRTKEIEDQLVLDIAAAEAKGRAQIEAWQDAVPDEDRCIQLFSGWIGNVERIDVLQRAAEERFAGTLRDIERHMASALERRFEAVALQATQVNENILHAIIGNDEPVASAGVEPFDETVDLDDPDVCFRCLIQP